MKYEKSPSEVQTEILGNIPATYDKRIGFPLWDITKAFAIGISNFLTSLTNVASKLDVSNLSGEELERFINERTGIERKKATYSTGVLKVFGTGVVPTGAIFETEGLVRFEATEEVVVTGSGVVAIKSINSGVLGNVAVNTITKMPITIQGIVSCTNEEETTGGYEEETDEDLLTRYYERLRTPATSGNIHHYKQWAKEVTGVGDAKVFPLWNGNNTVKVLILDSERKPAEEELINKVQEYIDPNVSGVGAGVAPIGAFCTVSTASAKNVNIRVKLVLKEGTVVSEIREKLKENISQYFSSLAFVSTTLSYPIVGARILNIDGVLDYTDLTINGGSSNLTCEETEVFVLSEVELVE